MKWSWSGLLIFLTGTLVAQVPTISSLVPTSGPVNSYVTIAGSNFGSTIAENTVFFGGAKAVVAVASPSSIVVQVPVGSGYARPIVSVNQFSGYSNKAFDVTFPSSDPLNSAAFGPRLDFATGIKPYGVIFADIDDDQKPDMVVANAGSPFVSIYRNTAIVGTISLSSFASRIDISTQSAPNNVAFGDLNGDGKLDLVTTNAGNTISVLVNSSTAGSITFSSRHDYLTNINPLEASVGDIDLDGRPDIVVACFEPDGVPVSYASVYRNTSSGSSVSFDTKVDFTVRQGAIAVAIGDLNNDSKPDLAILDYHVHYLSILENQGTPGVINASTFAPRLDCQTGSFPFGVTIGDIDGDGNNDILVGTGLSSSAISIFRNSGLTGTITASSFDTRVDIPTLNHAGPVILGDLDGDGRPDMTVGNPHGNAISIFRNIATPGTISSASFAARIDLPGGGSSTSYSTYRVAVNDIDSDSDPEIAVINYSSNTVSVYGNVLAPPPSFQIVASSAPGGEIDPPGTTDVTYGSDQVYTIAPNERYRVDSVIVDGVNQGTIDIFTFSNVMASHTISAFFSPDPGIIMGTVLSGSSTLAGVTVKLLDGSMMPIVDTLTNEAGQFTFSTLAPEVYYVMIVEPLGYSVDLNPKTVTLDPGESEQVLFTLTPLVVCNDGRGKGYWKHQFDVYVKGRGHAQETIEQLSSYMEAVQQHYTPHFDHFAAGETFEDWQDFLSKTPGASKREKALEHIAALVLNFASQKVGQYVVVTDDGRTSGEVLTFVSSLVANPMATDQDLDLAKNLSEKVNEGRSIQAGVVPASGVLYKGTNHSTLRWSFGTPLEFMLAHNYPNPFNPSTTIEFALPNPGEVSLKVYNPLGQEVATLVSKEMAAGAYKVAWDAAAMGSGVYFYRLHSGEFVQTKRMLLLK